MDGYDALVFNTQREDVVDFNHGIFALSENDQVGMKDFISSGKCFVCIHVGTILPDSWPELM